MPTIGIYLGQENDNTDNIESQINAWCHYLSDYDVDLYGSAEPPDSIAEPYDVFNTSPRSPANPIGKIVGAAKDSREYIDERDPDIIVQIWKYNVYGPGVCLGAVNSDVNVLTRFTGDTFDLFPRYENLGELIEFLLGDVVLGNIVGRIPLATSNKMIVLGPRGRSLVTSPPLIPYPSMEETNAEIIPPSVDVSDRFHSVDESKKREIRKDLGLPLEKTLCLFVGRLSKQKGMEFLDKVFHHLEDVRDNYQFVLVGSGPYKDTFDREYSSDFVRTEGYVDFGAIDRYYKASDVYVHPSGYEGVPLVILEALSCSLSVLARDAGDVGLVCDRPVETPDEMARRLLNRDYNSNWKNKDLFSPEYQESSLREVIEEMGPVHSNG